MRTRCGAIRPRTSVSTFSRNTARHIMSVDHGVTATRSDLIEPVLTLKLFFDLVFVFTITQLTAVLALDPDPLHLGSPAQRSPSARLAARVLFHWAGEGRGAH